MRKPVSHFESFECSFQGTETCLIYENGFLLNSKNCHEMPKKLFLQHIRELLVVAKLVLWVRQMLQLEHQQQPSLQSRVIALY